MAELPQTELNRKITDTDSLLKECDAIEAALSALKHSYEQYFLGLERQMPSGEHNDLKRRFNRLKTSFVRSTALKFKINGINAKIVTYERLWSRTVQEMESGTYRRDLLKLRAKHKDEEAAKKEKLKQEAIARAQPLGPKPGAPAQGAPKPQPAAAGEVLSDQKIRAIYDAYVTAKKRCQEDTSKLNFDSVAASLRKQVPEMMKKANVKSVEFKVVIKDGKAILRAVPKE